LYAFWRAKGPVPYQPGATPQEKRAKRSRGLKARSIPDPLHAIFGAESPEKLGIAITKPIYIGMLRGFLCYAAEIDSNAPAPFHPDP